MSFIKTEIEDVWVIEPNIFKDDRGYFYESFNAETFNKETGLNINFVQDNQSKSNKGVLRGMHYQTGEHAQAKLVRV
ncbi:MAG: dTDP-4-dehydrorhamnose 3,5-epimerase family protein, partial [Chitinophagales bacterium]